jgi:hypothetical protein
MVTLTSRYVMRADGIVVQEVINPCRQTLQHARENVAAFNTLASGRRCALLCDMRVDFLADEGVRRYYASAEATALCAALALLVRSPSTELIGNLVLYVNRPIVKTRLFSVERDAVTWLLEARGPATIAPGPVKGG